jgi:hypothetical protein
MSETLPPIDPELRALLRSAKRCDVAPSAAQERVLGRVEMSIGAAVAVGLAASATSSVAKGASRRVIAGWLAGPLAKTSLVFVVGGITGAGITRAIAPAPVPQVVYVDRPVGVVPAKPAKAPDLAPAPSPASESAAERSAATASSPALPSPPASSRGNQLAAERGLLDVARTALGRKDGESALAALLQHQQRFPRGALSEERDAMMVQALILQQRFGEAKAQGQAFRKRYPGSVLGPRVKSAIESIP